MAFRQCFFDTSEVTKIVLPKILIAPVGPGNWTKKVSSVTYNTWRDQRVPLSVFLALRLFSDKKFPKGPLFNFLEFCDRMDVEKSQRVPSNFFDIVRLGCCRREYFDTLQSFCYFWALASTVLLSTNEDAVKMNFGHSESDVIQELKLQSKYWQDLDQLGIRKHPPHYYSAYYVTLNQPRKMQQKVDRIYHLTRKLSVLFD